jgi:hypothetical protein
MISSSNTRTRTIPTTVSSYRISKPFTQRLKDSPSEAGGFRYEVS